MGCRLCMYRQRCQIQWKGSLGSLLFSSDPNLLCLTLKIALSLQIVINTVILIFFSHVDLDIIIMSLFLGCLLHCNLPLCCFDHLVFRWSHSPRSWYWTESLVHPKSKYLSPLSHPCLNDRVRTFGDTMKELDANRDGKYLAFV